MTERIRGSMRMMVVGAVMAAAMALFGSADARADPPGRVARLSYVAGPISFSPAGDDQWAEAVLNRPLVAGDRLWADASGRGELGFGAGSLWLGAATSVSVTNIDDRTAQFELQQGVLDLRVRQMAQGSIVEIDTPNLAFQVTRPGRYRVIVDPQGGTTSVLVRSGAGDVYGESAAYSIGPGQAYGFAGTNLEPADIVSIAGIDDFERFTDERDARYGRAQSARYVSPEVVGYEDLDQYGTWQQDAQYGNVWYPREVPREWAPYRYGHWSWIDPWGWTWVDAAPWGFAPFHYGRWAYTSNRWGWVPGPVNVRPVYAPALVAFVGGAGFSIGVSSGPAIGWFPLAPREVYRPSYNVSRNYYRQVNVSNTVINTTIINNTYVSNFTTTAAPPIARTNYRNLHVANAITAVPPAAFAQAQRVDRVAVNMPAAAVERAQIQSLARVAPSRKAFTGDAPAARDTPPAAVQHRTVIAKSVPPPAATPVAQRVTALERNPGKPVDRSVVQPTRNAPGPGAPAAGAGAGAEAATHNVKVVNPTKAGAPEPITQRESRPGRGAPPTGTPATPATPATPSTAPATRATPAVPATPSENAVPRARENESKGRPGAESNRPAPGSPTGAAPPNVPVTPMTRPPAPRPEKVAPAAEPPKEPAKGAPARSESPGAIPPERPMNAPRAVPPRPAEPAIAPAPPKTAEPAPPHAVPQERPRPAPPAATPPRPTAPAAAPTPPAHPAEAPPPRAQPRPAPEREVPGAAPPERPHPQAEHPAPPKAAPPQPAPPPRAQPQPAPKAPAAEQPKRNAPREQDKEKDKEKEKQG